MTTSQASDDPAIRTNGTRQRTAGAGGRSARRFRTNLYWRIAAHDRLAQLEAEAATLSPRPPLESAIADVNEALHASPGPRSWFSGADVERAWRALHRIEVMLVDRCDDLVGRLPAILERVEKHLPENDPRRVALKDLVVQAPQTPSPGQKAIVREALAGALARSDDAHSSLRRLRNLLMFFGAGLLALDLVLALLATWAPGALALCGADSSGIPCATGAAGPTGGDVWLLQGLGLLGAFLSVVVSLQRSDGTSFTYTLVPFQALMKLSLGAVLPVLGVMLAASGALQELIANRPALLLFAVALGYAQEAVTRLVDRYVAAKEKQARPAAG